MTVKELKQEIEKSIQKYGDINGCVTGISIDLNTYQPGKNGTITGITLEFNTQ